MNKEKSLEKIKNEGSLFEKHDRGVSDRPGVFRDILIKRDLFSYKFLYILKGVIPSLYIDNLFNTIPNECMITCIYILKMHKGLVMIT